MARRLAEQRAAHLPPAGLAFPPFSASPPFTSFPAYVRRDTLLQHTGIDSRPQDVLVVDVRVSAAHCKGTPIISSVQYRTNDEARRDCAVAFIKKETGLAMLCPTVPGYLVLRGAAFDTAVSQLSPEQREWHDQLSSRRASALVL